MLSKFPLKHSYLTGYLLGIPMLIGFGVVVPIAWVLGYEWAEDYIALAVIWFIYHIAVLVLTIAGCIRKKVSADVLIKESILSLSYTFYSV